MGAIANRTILNLVDNKNNNYLIKKVVAKKIQSILNPSEQTTFTVTEDRKTEIIDFLSSKNVISIPDETTGLSVKDTVTIMFSETPKAIEALKEHGYISSEFAEEILQKYNEHNQTPSFYWSGKRTNYWNDGIIISENNKPTGFAGGVEIPYSFDFFLSSFTSLDFLQKRKELSNEEQLSLFSELRKIYSSIDNLIFEKLKISKEEGKKLILLVCEDHTEKKSFLIEALILRLAVKHNIFNLLLEGSEQLHNNFRTNTKDCWVNASPLLKMADDLQLNTIPTEPEEGLDDPIRTLHMKIKLDNLEDNAIFILGLGHINSIKDNHLSSKYEFVKINIANIDDEKFQTYDDFTKKEISPILNSNKIIHVNLNTNLTNVSSDQIIEFSKKSYESLQHTTNEINEIDLESLITQQLSNSIQTLFFNSQTNLNQPETKEKNLSISKNFV